MIQTTLEITFSDDNFAGVAVETSADGELKLQAELVGFAHLAATVISSLGRERAQALPPALDSYNRDRPHRALGGHAPLQGVNDLSGTNT